MTDPAETVQLEPRRLRALPRPTERWDHLTVIAGSALYLLVSLFTGRGVPFLLGGDQVYFWLYAQRMLAGELPFRDFLQFTPPGTNLVFVAAFWVLGQRIWVVNLVALLLGIALAWTCFRIGRAFLTRLQSMLAAGLFLVLIYGKVLMATHHWFSALAVMTAVAVLMKQRTTPRIAAAGTLLGVAMFFTQTRGPAAFVGLAAYLLWERDRTNQPWRECCKRIAFLFVSLVVAWMILASYFIATAGLSRITYWLATYLVRYHSSTVSGLGLPEDFAWRHASSYAQVLLVYAMLPVVYCVSLVSAWKNRRRADDERMLLTLAGVAMLAEVAMSPNWLRVYCASAPGVMLLVWAVSRHEGLRRVATVLLWFLLICAMCWGPWSRRREQNTLAQLPAGLTLTTKTQAAKLEWVAAHTGPGESFFQAAWPGVYLPLQLRDPAFVDAFLPADETRPELVEETIRQLEAAQVHTILWSPRLNTPMLPARPGTYHLAPFRDYLQAHYQRVMVFADLDEVWERQ